MEEKTEKRKPGRPRTSDKFSPKLILDVDEDLYNRISELCDTTGKSRASVIRSLIELGLMCFDKKITLRKGKTEVEVMIV